MMEAILTEQPFAMAEYFRSVIHYGAILGTGTAALNLISLLCTNVDFDSQRERILFWCILFRFLLYCFQLPFRVSMYKTLNSICRLADRQIAAQHMLALHRSFVWRLNHYVGVLLYVWVTYVFYVFYRHGVRDLPSTNLLNFSWVSVINMTGFLWMMRVSFSKFNDLVIGDSSTPNGLSVDVIERHTTRLKFTQQLKDEKGLETCFICLAEYTDDCELRCLPCRHIYHPGCIDVWLNKKRTCPLCLHAVDKPFVVATPRKTKAA